MHTIDIKDAKKIYNGIVKNDYLGWQEYAYNRAVIYPLDSDTYIEHRKDKNYCSLKGKDWRYCGDQIKHCNLVDMNGIKYLYLLYDNTALYVEVINEENHVTD